MKKLVLFSIIVLGISSCKNDLDLNADYKEIPVVYGILNQNDSIHYVKITKAFLGEGNANNMAMVRDSSEYPDGVLKVTLKEENIGNPRTIDLKRIEITNKESGNFYSPNQYVYAIKNSELSGTKKLNISARYKLTVENLSTGNIAEATTMLIDNGQLNIANRLPSLSFYNNSTKEISSPQIRINGAIGAERHSGEMIIEILEIKLAAPFDTIVKKIKFKNEGLRKPNINISEEIIWTIGGDVIISEIIKALPVDESIERFIGKVYFTTYAASEDLDIFMSANEPSNGLVQDKPVFTNLSNGLGIFASRTYSNKQIYVNANSAKYLKDTYPNRNFTKFWNENGAVGNYSLIQ